MHIIVQIFDGMVGLVCLVVVADRYRGSRVRIVAGDLILWTATLFFVLPLFLAAVDFVTSYPIYPELGVVDADPLASVLTAITVFVCIWMIARAVRICAEAPRQPGPSFPTVRPFWLLLCFLPIFVVFGAPNPSVYERMAAVIRDVGPGQAFDATAVPPTVAANYQIYVTGAAYVSAVALAMWLFSRRTGWAFLMVLPVGIIDFWLAGKRNIVALIVILSVLALLRTRSSLHRKSLRRRLIIGLIGLVGVIWMAQWFEHEYRSTVIAGRSHEIYQLDFGRLDVIRLAIADQIGVKDVPRPLSYWGQSVVLYGEQFADRLTHHKPISYEDRVTSIAFQEPIQSQPGSITTTVVSEAIDNFGLVGVIVGPYILVLLIRASERQRDPMQRVLLAIFGSLIIATNVTAAAPIIALMVLRWLGLRIYSGLAPPHVAESREFGAGGMGHASPDVDMRPFRVSSPAGW